MKKVISIISVILIIILFLIPQNNYIQTSEYIMSSNKIENLKIVQLSDLHDKSFGKNQEKLIEKVNILEPDIVVLTGDMIDFQNSKGKLGTKPCLDLVKGISNNTSIFYIPGNHEIRHELQEALFNSLEDLGVIVLEDETYEYSDDITITGIRDKGFFKTEKEFYRTLRKLSSNIDKDKYNILLSHRPQYISLYEDLSFDIIFSGHAHGGQVRIPFLIPNGIYAPHQGLFPKYTNGVHTLSNNSNLVISRGLGNSRCPLRIFNFPEIVFLEIKK